jgi:septum formation protein
VKVVLASRSPQRRAILEGLGVEFEVVDPDVEELVEGEPEAVVLENARRKARTVERPGAIVIGCDTEVLLDGELLGKAGNEEEARRHLGRLSGREHEVLSGLVLLGPNPGQERSGVARSTVTFRQLTEQEIDSYVKSAEWRERAGAYAIQGQGSGLVAGVEGETENVIGLPVRLLLDLAPDLVAGRR